MRIITPSRASLKPSPSANNWKKDNKSFPK